MPAPNPTSKAAAQAAGAKERSDFIMTNSPC
jgi:hypothetical protein